MKRFLNDAMHDTLSTVAALRAKADVPAAVLIAITDRVEPGAILTVRRDNMRTHAGQVAFPGGRIDAGEDACSVRLRDGELLLSAARTPNRARVDPKLTEIG
jgi:8-oxo-dGTP pyrophosphatase MutT (NUDIX family)